MDEHLKTPLSESRLLHDREGKIFMADSDLRERGYKWERLLRKAGKAVSGVFGISQSEFAARDLTPTETTLDEIRDEIEAILDEIILLQGHFGETITVAELQTAIESLK